MAINIKNAADFSEVVSQTVRQVGTTGNIVEDLFDKGFALKEARAALNKSRNAVRDALRNLDESGILSDEQSADLAELFPPRGSGVEDAEDAADNGATA